MRFLKKSPVPEVLTYLPSINEPIDGEIRWKNQGAILLDLSSVMVNRDISIILELSKFKAFQTSTNLEENSINQD